MYDQDWHNLIELCRARASAQSSAGYVFLTDGENLAGFRSYRDLNRRARAIGAALQQRHAAGSRVLLMYPQGLDFIDAFFGCIYGGMIAVPVYPPDPLRPVRSRSRLEAIVKDARPPVLLTASGCGEMAGSLTREMENKRFGRMEVLFSDKSGDELVDDWRDPDVNRSTIAFLQYTSGSTALPKGVIVSHGNLLRNEEMIKQACGHSEQSTLVGWLPFYHDMGLIGNIVQPLYIGSNCVLMSPSAFLERPFRWLNAITKYRAETSGGPDFAYDLCVRKVTEQERQSLDLSSWTVAFNGAEPVRAETMRRFAAVFESCGFDYHAFYPCYGLAEATLIVSGGRKGSPPILRGVDLMALGHGQVLSTSPDSPDSCVLASSGRIIEGQKVVIADPVSCRRSGDGEIGEIWLSGPNVALGYWERPDESLTTFNAYLVDTGEGPFLRTGDMGFMLSDELFITGRLKDLIIIRGRNHYPQDIELTAERSHRSLRRGCGAAFSVDGDQCERLVVVHEVNGKDSANPGDIVRDVCKNIAEQHNVSPYAVVLIKAGTIPKTSSGKIQRHACREHFLEGRLNVLFEWRATQSMATDSEASDFQLGPDLDGFEAVERRLALRLAELVGTEPEQIDQREPIAAYGLDSLSAIQLAHWVESSFGVRVGSGSLLEGLSIAELANRLRGAGGLITDSLDGFEPAITDELSHGQMALWYFQKMAPGSSALNIATALRIKGRLDVERLREALQCLSDRHAVLRSTFGEAGGRLVRRSRSGLPAEFRVENAETWSESRLQERLNDLANQPFDLGAGPLFIATLFNRSSYSSVLLLTAHHIIADFWSVEILLNELVTAYENGASALPPLYSDFSRFVAWQSELLAGPEGESLKAYWKEQLQAVLSLPYLPADRPRPLVPSYNGATLRFRLGAELTSNLLRIAHSHHTTLSTVVLSALDVLLYFYSGQNEFVVASIFSGRTRAEFKEVVGYFVNPVLLRTSIVGELSFGRFLIQVRRSVNGAMDHQECPLGAVLGGIEDQRSAGGSALARAMFVFQKSRAGDRGIEALCLGWPGGQVQLGRLAMKVVEIEHRSVQADLLLVTALDGESLIGSFRYSRDLFDHSTIERLAGHFETLLNGIAEDPDCAISHLPLITAEERRQLTDWNNTFDAYPGRGLIHQLIEDQVSRTSESVALVKGERCVTYFELNLRANRLAYYLRSKGVGPETRVVICMSRSLEMVIALLAVLKAGGVYVPVDPDYPEDRIRFILESARAKVVLAEARTVSRLSVCKTTVVLDQEVWADSETDDRNPVTGTEEINLAYVIYTSGSTGSPKGVAIEHRSVVAFLQWGKEQFSADALNAVLASTSICFDLSVFEIFAPLCCGGTVVLVENALELLNTERSIPVTLINTVPSAAAELAKARVIPDSVVVINLAGEAVTAKVVDLIFSGSKVGTLYNLYGPTEDTTYSTYAVLIGSDSREPPIGHPIANTQVHVVHRAFDQAPVGVPGEIVIGGDGLARGYLDRAELTAERFVPNPFAARKGARLYRTGDIGRRRSDGQLEFLGRSDQQVKLRGYRIELGEIESVMAEHPDVLEAAAVLRETEGESRILAYVCGRPGYDSSLPQRIQAHLMRRLPRYMLPWEIVVLERLPRTANGKLDRRALPGPARASLESTGLLCRTPTEQVLSYIWSDVLGIPVVLPTANFFDLGGHSLLAAQTVARVRDMFGVDLLLRNLFDQPTVRELAAVIDTLLSESERPLLPAVVGFPRDQVAPLSFAQERMWFLDQFSRQPAAYNMSGGIEIIGRQVVIALEQALNEIRRRHESLRTIFPLADGRPVQVVLEPELQPLPVIDISGVSGPSYERELDSLLKSAAVRRFDLTICAPLKSALFRLSDEALVLFTGMHHIVSDGWSVSNHLKETQIIYDAFSRGIPSPLSELEIQYADFSIWQRELIESAHLKGQLDYWRQRLDGAPEMLDLPVDRPRPAIMSFEGKRRRVEISAAAVESLRELSRRQNVTLFMTLLATFQVWLARHTGQEDILVGTPVAGRPGSSTEPLIGVFVNTLLMRAKLDANPTFLELLARTRQDTLEAYRNQDLPFEKVVEGLRLARGAGHSPGFQAMFSLGDFGASSVTFGEVTARVFEIDTGTAKQELSLSLQPARDRLSGYLEYNTDILLAASIDRMWSRFEALIVSAVQAPAQPIYDLSMMTTAERHQLLTEWNRNAEDYPRDVTVRELFEAQVLARADAVAVADAVGCLTYGELDRRANRLARHLGRLGAGPERIVAVSMQRAVGMVVAFLGVLKCGAAYLPMDPLYPHRRQQQVLGEADICALITHGGDLPNPGPTQLPVLRMDMDWEAIAHEPVSAPDTRSVPESLAYLIFTSGSTGKPKGVEIQHRGLVNLLTWHQRYYGLTANDRASMVASPAFDASVWELWPYLTSGASVHIAEAETVASVETLVDWLSREQITHSFLSTPLAESLIDSPYAERFFLRVLLTGGDRLRKIGRSLPFVFVNHYGPTENTVVATCAPVTAGAKSLAPPIGRPISNQQVYVLDHHFGLAPTGVAGELTIGGVGLARGYHGHPDLTAESFVPDPFSEAPGGRLYRTGDLTRLLQDGELEYLGRIDHQVKVRGFRIELGEIETLLTQHDSIEAAAVAVDDDLHGGKRLIAYLSFKAGSAPEIATIREYLRDRLPEQMIPATWVSMERLPVTENGKIDRRALPPPDRLSHGPDESFSPSRTSAQEALANLWNELLGVNRIGIDMSFFDIGGHSLLAAQMVSRIRDLFMVDVPLHVLFERPTIEGLAEFIETSSAGNDLRFSRITRAPRERFRLDAVSESAFAEK